MVDYLVSGGARVSWELARHFIDPGTYTFQLQAGHTGLEDADDWEDVDVPVVNTYFKLDNTQRLFGKTLDLYYRVKLTTDIDTYYSIPQNCFGKLLKRDWLKAKEIIRKELLRHRVLTSSDGYLLKARRYGPPCTDCSDVVTELTGEIANSHCASCYGTGFEFGYFSALPGTYADVGLEKNAEKRDPQIGMVKPQAIQARFIGDPLLYTYDIWVEGTSDLRYYITEVDELVQMRSVPLVFNATLKLAPFTDVVYTIPLGIGPTKLIKQHESEQNQWKQVNKPQNQDILDKMKIELKNHKRRSSRQ